MGTNYHGAKGVGAQEGGRERRRVGCTAAEGRVRFRIAETGLRFPDRSLLRGTISSASLVQKAATSRAQSKVQGPTPFPPATWPRIGQQLRKMKKISHGMPRTNESRLDEIRARFRERQPLNLSAVEVECPWLLDRLFEPDHCVGWRASLEAAGVPPEQIAVRLSIIVRFEICAPA